MNKFYYSLFLVLGLALSSIAMSSGTYDMSYGPERDRQYDFTGYRQLNQLSDFHPHLFMSNTGEMERTNQWVIEEIDKDFKGFVTLKHTKRLFRNEVVVLKVPVPKTQTYKLETVATFDPADFSMKTINFYEKDVINFTVCDKAMGSHALDCLTLDKDFCDLILKAKKDLNLLEKVREREVKLQVNHGLNADINYFAQQKKKLWKGLFPLLKKFALDKGEYLREVEINNLTFNKAKTSSQKYFKDYFSIMKILKYSEFNFTNMAYGRDNMIKIPLVITDEEKAKALEQTKNHIVSRVMDRRDYCEELVFKLPPKLKLNDLVNPLKKKKTY